MQKQRATLGLTAVLVLAACDMAEKEPAAAEPAATEPAAAEPAAAEEHAAHPAGDHEPPAIPAGAKVFFEAPAAGEVKGPEKDGKVTVTVKMGAEGIAVEPAGEQKAGSGHHHILIDSDPVPKGTVVPKDETHLHFGKGQTEAEVPLTPGKHSLTLQFADGHHLSYGPELSAKVDIDVVAEPATK